MIKNELIISIAGMAVKLKLHEGVEINGSDMFVRNIKHVFKPFIEKKPNGAADIELHVIEREKIMDKNSITRKGKVCIPLLQKKKGKNEIFYDLSVPQFYEILRRLIFEGVYSRKGLIIHASSLLNRNGRVDLFIAPSGGGKTTILNLLSPPLSAFTDDAVLIKKEARKYYGYQIPFSDRYTMLGKKMYKKEVGNLYFIHQALCNTLTRIDHVEAMNRLLSRSIRTKKMVKNAMSFCLEHDHFFDLFFSHTSNSQDLLKILGNNSESK